LPYSKNKITEVFLGFCIDSISEKRYHSLVMDLDKLRQLVRRLGSVVLFDGNKPELVVLPYDKLNGEEFVEENVEESNNDQELERLNSEILALREELAERERDLQVMGDEE